MVISEVGNVFIQSADIAELANASYLALTHFVQLIKHSYILFYNKRVNNLFHSINRTEFQPKTTKQRKILEKYMIFSQITSYVGLGACLATCCFWAINSFLEENELALPLDLWYPFDTKNSTIFLVVYIYQLVTPIILAWGNAACDLVISGT